MASKVSGVIFGHVLNEFLKFLYYCMVGNIVGKFICDLTYFDSKAEKEAHCMGVTLRTQSKHNIYFY